MSHSMPSRNDGAAKRAILDVVERVTCEKPMPVELGFVLKRLAGMAEADAELREEQPWKARPWTCSTTARSNRCGSGAGCRRPLIAAGNSNGDIEMLQYAGGRSRPGLRLLIDHDDDQREFAYTAGAEKALEQAAAQSWTVVSVKDDWSTVFADLSGT